MYGGAWLNGDMLLQLVSVLSEQSLLLYLEATPQPSALLLAAG
jgi:hypothetical protein